MNTSNKSLFVDLKNLWIPAGIAAAVLLSLVVLGNVLLIGDKLGRVSGWLELGFYVGLTALLAWLLRSPIRVLTMPRLPVGALSSVESSNDHDLHARLAKAWVRTGALAHEPHEKLSTALTRGSDLRPIMKEVVGEQHRQCDQIIRDHALSVFVATSVSQNGRLDAVIVLITQFRMIGRLVSTCGYRPSFVELARLYARVFVAAFVADRVDDLDVGALVTGAFKTTLNALPGGEVISAVAAPAINSLTSGGLNAYLTLRTGYATKACLLEGGMKKPEMELKREAAKKARGAIGEIVKQRTVTAVTQLVSGKVEPNHMPSGSTL